MAKPPGWKTLATDLPQQKAYEYTRLLERVTGKESVRQSLAELLERKAKEVEVFEQQERFHAEWIDTHRPDIKYQPGMGWVVSDAYIQTIFDAWAKAQDRAFNAEEKLREMDKKWDDLVALCKQQIVEIGEEWAKQINCYAIRYNLLEVAKAEVAKAFLAETQELRRKLARLEEPST